jgi:hypothetical protein
VREEGEGEEGVEEEEVFIGKMSSIGESFCCALLLLVNGSMQICEWMDGIIPP